MKRTRRIRRRTTPCVARVSALVRKHYKLVVIQLCIPPSHLRIIAMPPLAGVVRPFSFIADEPLTHLNVPVPHSPRARPTTIPSLLKLVRALFFLSLVPRYTQLVSLILSDELKYRTKYRQLRAKVGEIEEVSRYKESIIIEARLSSFLNIAVRFSGELQAPSKDPQSEAKHPATETRTQVSLSLLLVLPVQS
jgi:hypothetical protein